MAKAVKLSGARCLVAGTVAGGVRVAGAVVPCVVVQVRGSLVLDASDGQGA